MNETEAETTWRDRAPMYLKTGTWHDGATVAASVDRQWLWRLENSIALGPQADSTRLLWRDLKQYLNETCEHEWRLSEDYGGPNGESARPIRQCQWCYETQWLRADGAYGEPEPFQVSS